MESIYIINGARTPFGSFGGSLKDVTDIELAVAATTEAIRRSGLTPKEIEDVSFGNVIHTNKASSYLARHIGLKSGIPEKTPALTVNRLCGSGMQAVVSCAQNMITGDAETAVAGGTENMSQSPHVLRGTRFGSQSGSPKIDDMLWATLTDEYLGSGMGITAENLVDKYRISRKEQDEFAVKSHQKAAKARETGRFLKEITPITISDKKNRQIMISDDEHIRPDINIENLARLHPAFKNIGTVTAGNASGINDGAAAVVLGTGSFFKERKDIDPLARIVSWGIAGVDPRIMGIGPLPASELALKKAGLSWKDIDLFEFNEAFAAQVLSILKNVDIDPEKVNVNGGAIALGHPVGASGARIIYSLALEMKLRSARYGLASLCIGGGQGIAMIIERA